LLARDRVSGELSKLSGNFDRLGTRIMGFAKLAAGAFLAGGIIGGLKDSIKAASDLNEAQNKVQVLFGSSTAQIQKWAAQAATSMGMSTLGATDAAATMGVFGNAAGLTGGKLVDFSTKMAGLSSDLASFYNTSPEDAMQAIGAALRGEQEPIRRYGILLDDASLRQQAFAMHLTNTTKHVLTPQQRVLAAQALILKQSSKAQGDFARTSGGLANQQRIMAAEITNAKAKLGDIFLPAAAKVATFLTTKLIPGFAGVTDKISGFIKWMTGGSNGAKVFIAVAGGLVVGILAVTTAVKLATIAQAAFNAIMALNPIGIVIVAIIALVGAFIYLWNTSAGFRNFWKDLWKNIKTWAIDAKNGVVGAWNAFIGFFAKLPGRIGGIAVGMWDGIKNAFRSAVNWIIAKWNNLSLTIGGQSVDLPFGMGFSIPSITLNTPDIPYLARGGIVTRPTLAVLGERGPEAVTPLGSAPITLVIESGGSQMDDLLVQMIRRAVRVRGGGNVQVAFGR